MARRLVDFRYNAASMILLLAATVLGTSVALGGRITWLEIALIGACIAINGVRALRPGLLSHPVTTVIWVLVFINVPVLYLLATTGMLGLPPAHGPDNQLPMVPVIISLAVPFQVFAAFVPSIPKAQYLVLMFVLVQGILGARTQVDLGWKPTAALMCVVALCAVMAHVGSVSSRLRANANALQRRSLSPSQVVRAGGLMLVVPLLLSALIFAAASFILLPRPTAGGGSADQGSGRFRPGPDGETPGDPGSEEEVEPDASHVTGLSREMRLGDFGAILQDDTIEAQVEIRHPDAAIYATAPRLRVSALTEFDGERWYVFGRERTGRLSPWQPVDSSGMLKLRHDPRSVHNLVTTAVTFVQPQSGERLSMMSIGRPYQVLGTYGVTSDGGAGELDSAFEYLDVNEEVRATTRIPGQRIWSYQIRGVLEAPIEQVSDKPAPALTGSSARLPNQISALLALNWREQGRFEALRDRPLELARAVDQWLRQSGDFTYSLSPAVRSPDGIVGFITNPAYRSGHCEYFAAAMAVILRHFDVQARIVIGYRARQPGERAGTWLVRRSDAHAWVEAKVDAGPWVTFDPTPPDYTQPAAGSPQVTGGDEFDTAAFDFDLLSEFDADRRARVLNALWSWLSSRASDLLALMAAPFALLPDWGRPPTWLASLLVLLFIGALAVVVMRRFRKLTVRRRMVKEGLGSTMARTKRKPELRAVHALWRELLEAVAASGFSRKPHQTPAEFAAAMQARGGEKYAGAADACRAYGELRYDPRLQTGGEAASSRVEELEAAFRSALDQLRRLS